MPTTDEASEEYPVYSVRQATGLDTVFKTSNYMVVVDEGWRLSIVCSGMYEWAAKWLVGQLQGKPYAPESRP